MQDTSRFQRDTIGNWKLESVISSPGITLPSLLSLLVKSMFLLLLLLLLYLFIIFNHSKVIIL